MNADRAKRKRDQVQNIVFAVRKVVKPGDRIVDFCAGGGHVAIVLAYFLPSCTVSTFTFFDTLYLLHRPNCIVVLSYAMFGDHQEVGSKTDQKRIVSV